jgi:signal transduction histidine kinase
MFEYSPWIWLIIGTTIIGAALFQYSRRYEGFPETKYFQVLILVATAWTVLQAAVISVTDLESKVLLTELKFAFAPYLCVAVFGLLTSMDGHGNWFDRRGLVVISIVPAITTVLALTSQWHTLFMYDFALAGQGPTVLHSTEGLWYWFYLAYSYALITVALIVLIDSVRGSNSLYRKQAAIIALSFIPPFAFDILQNSLQLFGEMDLAPATFIFSGIIMAWGLYRYRLLDVCPIARGEVVENMTDAVLIIDNDLRLIDINQSVRPFLIVSTEAALGTPISAALPFGTDLLALIRSGGARGEIKVGSVAGRPRTYDASVMPFEVRGELRARMVLMRDITERKRAEEALQAANDRLNLLSSMTRHDLLNQLTVVDGYVALASKENDPEKVRAYLAKTESSSEAARQLIEFTGDYERVGIKAPSWLNVGELFSRATRQFPLDRIEVSSNTEGLSIYADAMLEKVLYNLIDNTLRHGGSVSRISLDFEECCSRLALIYRDDGVGVPAKDKPLIFLRGFGANKGLGLFLARDVLAITGIDIFEDGGEGEGARFELIVPAGGFRLERHAGDIVAGVQKGTDEARSAH